MTHSELVRNAREAIISLFGDTSVPKETTRHDLEDLKDFIEASLDALKDD